MPALEDAGVDDAIDAFTLLADHISIHTAYSAAGANEATGGSPAYARMNLAWDAASGRIGDNTDAEQFDLAAATYEYLGFWDSLTTGVFCGMVPLGSTFAKVANIWNTGDLIELPTHGLSADDRVALFDLGNTALPSGPTEGTLYHVISSATNDFQISATQGGAAVTISADGQGLLMDAIPVVLGAQGNIDIAAGALDVEGSI